MCSVLMGPGTMTLEHNNKCIEPTNGGTEPTYEEAGLLELEDVNVTRYIWALDAEGDTRSTLGPQPLGAQASAVDLRQPSSPPRRRGALASFAELAIKLPGEKDGY